MTLRLLACIECDQCHQHFEKIVSIQGLRSEALSDEVHQLVLAAEEDEWECRKNATEHLCARCIERIHNPF
jgi:hypothetical protein